MKYEIDTAKAFEPITVTIHLETLEEALEFQARMELKKYRVNDAVKATAMFTSILDDGDAMTGIGNMRGRLHQILGQDSLTYIE